MTDNSVTGIDYLTGKDGIPVGELRFVKKGNADTEDSAIFPETPPGFADFAAMFVKKYGVSEASEPPIVVTPESLGVIRSYYDETDGRINRVSDSKARKSW